jgi:predicted phage terminase large subunit-like protein
MPACLHRYDYEKLMDHLRELEDKGNKKQYLALVKQIAESDFWFFMYYVLDFPIAHPYLVALAYRLQDHKDDPYLYLAAGRGSWKSTFLTIGLSLWETALDANMTTLIVSYQRQMAGKQLLGIKRNVENIPLLSQLWPDTFYSSGDFRSKLTDKWNEYAGLFVKRSLNSSDPTFAAFGFIEGMPTGMHFRRILIDDPVTLDNTATIESIEKVRSGFRMLTGLKDKVNGCNTRVVTTRYDINDLSKDIIANKKYIHIIIPAEVDATGEAKFDSIPCYMTREQLDQEREDYGDAYYAAQMLQNPTLGGGSALDPAWLDNCYYEALPTTLNYYILIDPAGSKSKRSDFSVFVIVGLSPDKQFFLVDMVRDKLDVYERYATLKDLHKRYRPDGVFYEQQGMQSDLEVFEREQRADKYYINIERYSSNVSGNKHRRIMALGAMFRKGEYFLPNAIFYNGRDLIEEFLEEEYKKYPHNRAHDDMLDAMSMITQVSVIVPEPSAEDKQKNIYPVSTRNPLADTSGNGSWMSDFCQTW